MSKLFQTQCPQAMPVIIICISLLLMGCMALPYPSPANYDLNRPVKMELGKVLNEISGLTYYPQQQSLLAISDSKEKVIEINPKVKKLKDVTANLTSSAPDFEDIVLLDSTIYILASKGQIWMVPIYAADNVQPQVYELNIKGKNDFETLYYDTTARGLIMLCKECEMEKGQHARMAFRFDVMNKTFDESPYYTISTEAVKNAVNDSKADFNPSAAAIHPFNKQLYILSSAGQLLVIADSKGKVLEAYKLNPDLYPQAEGIAFAPNGDMYISNEGKYEKPTLLLFPYHKK